MSSSNTYTLHSYAGAFTPKALSHPALAFLDAYTANLRAGHLTTEGWAKWYAPQSVFYNCDGRVIRGGEAIWNWAVGEVFGPFESIRDVEERRRLRVMEGAAPDFYEDDLTADGTVPKDADVVLHEHTIVLAFKDERLRGEPVCVRRMMEWIIGKAQPGQGTHGYQVYQVKLCWDRSVVDNEIQRRLVQQ